MNSPNPLMSTTLPNFQKIIDSTALKAFMKCPQYYKLKHIDGWAKENLPPPLAWGILFHFGLEQLEKART